MCRNIRMLFNFQPPVTEEEIRAAALQYVRKVSGTARPSQANQAVFDAAVAQVEAATLDLVRGLVTSAPPRDRAVERDRAKERSARRFAHQGSGSTRNPKATAVEACPPSNVQNT